jgi:hypothetical protein
MKASPAMLWILLLPCAVTLSGCSAPAGHRSSVAPLAVPKGFRTVETQRSLIVRHEVRYWLTSAFGGVTADRTLLPGEYHAALENADGTFYAGPGACLLSRYGSDGAPYPQRCGIFIPFNESAAPRVYLSRYKVGEAGAQGAVDTTANAATTVGTYANTIATPAAAGVGAGLGMVIVGAIIEAGADEEAIRNNVFFDDPQPVEDELRAAIELQTDEVIPRD